MPLTRFYPVLLAVTVLLTVTACASNTSDSPGKTRADGGSGTSGPISIGKAGPTVGTCLTHAYAEVLTADVTVACTVEHTTEIARVIDGPAGLDPAVKTGKVRLDQITDAQCPNANTYVGYRGILNSAIGPSYTIPTKKARANGAHWVACTVAVYISPPTPTGKFTFRERTSPIKGTLTTDRALLAEGTACVPDKNGGDTVACVAGKGQWLGLAYRPDVKPFTSAEHQGDYAKSFCQAAADAYGKNRPPWRGFWSVTATEGSGQNCLIALKNFNSAAIPVVLGRSQTDFKTPIEVRFAAKLKTIGQRLANEPALMSQDAQRRDLRSSRDYFPREVQDRTLCTVLSCTDAFSIATGTAGNTTTFTTSVPFEDKSCTGSIEFPLAYLGAPSSVTGVACK